MIAIYENPRTGLVVENGESHDCVVLGWVVDGETIKALICDEGKYSSMGARARTVDANKVTIYYAAAAD